MTQTSDRDDDDAADDEGPIAASLAYEDEQEYLSEYEGYFDDGAMYDYDELFESEEQLALPDEVSGAVCPPDIAGDHDTVEIPECVTVCSLQELD